MPSFQQHLLPVPCKAVQVWRGVYHARPREAYRKPPRDLGLGSPGSSSMFWWMEVAALSIASWFDLVIWFDVVPDGGPIDSAGF